MKLEPIETSGMSHHAYLAADEGEAAVVDARPAVDEYIGGGKMPRCADPLRHRDAEAGGQRSMRTDHQGPTTAARDGLCLRADAPGE